MNGPRLITSLALAGGFALATGCSTLTVQHPQIAAVKSVAIIGYSAELDLAEKNDGGKLGGIGATIGAVRAVTDISSGAWDEKRRVQADQTYDLLSKKLAAGTGWSVSARDALVANAAYKQSYDTHVGAGAGTGLTARFSNHLFCDGVIWSSYAGRLSSDERKQILDALGVDAIAVATVKFKVGKTSGFAIGSVGSTAKHPEAVIDFTVYDASSADPIWRDRWAEGEPTERGLRKTMGVESDANMTEIIVEAADSGYDALLRRFKESKQP